MRTVLIGAAVAMAACSGNAGAPVDGGADLAAPVPADLAITCVGSAPTARLVEGYCRAGEADRCYYAQPPLDGY